MQKFNALRSLLFALFNVFIFENLAITAEVEINNINMPYTEKLRLVFTAENGEQIKFSLPEKGNSSLITVPSNIYNEIKIALPGYNKFAIQCLSLDDTPIVLTDKDIGDNRMGMVLSYAYEGGGAGCDITTPHKQ